MNKLIWQCVVVLLKAKKLLYSILFHSHRQTHTHIYYEWESSKRQTCSPLFTCWTISLDITFCPHWKGSLQTSSQPAAPQKSWAWCHPSQRHIFSDTETELVINFFLMHVKWRHSSVLKWFKLKCIKNGTTNAYYHPSCPWKYKIKTQIAHDHTLTWAMYALYKKISLSASFSGLDGYKIKYVEDWRTTRRWQCYYPTPSASYTLQSRHVYSCC